MRVVDTSAWIEWFTGGPLYGAVAGHFPPREHCLVPTLVQLELAKWLAREADDDHANEIIAYTRKCVVVPLDTHIALAAAELHRQYKLATADSVIYASALEHGADLLTCDAHFAELPGVILIRKVS